MGALQQSPGSAPNREAASTPSTGIIRQICQALGNVKVPAQLGVGLVGQEAESIKSYLSSANCHFLSLFSTGTELAPGSAKLGSGVGLSDTN